MDGVKPARVGAPVDHSKNKALRDWAKARAMSKRRACSLAISAAWDDSPPLERVITSSTRDEHCSNDANAGRATAQMVAPGKLSRNASNAGRAKTSSLSELE